MKKNEEKRHMEDCYNYVVLLLILRCTNLPNVEFDVLQFYLLTKQVLIIYIMEGILRGN